MRIVIVKLSAIGDVVHALPAVAALRRALPAAHLAWVVEKRAAAILKDSPVIDDLIEIDTRAWRKRPVSRATLSGLREGFARVRGDAPIDVAVDFQGLLKSAMVIKATKARRRIGFENADLREPLSRLFLTEQVATASLDHVIEKNLALARAVIGGLTESGTESDDAAYSPRLYEFPINLSADDAAYAEAAASQSAAPFAILNPGGGWPTKLWPAERFGELADQLYEQHGMVSYITFGPGEEGLARAVAGHSRSGAARVIASTLKQFIALSRRAALFVGGDTGPLHLAAAVGTPIVGLYGPTSPARNGPFNPQDITVGRDLWCRSDCHRRTCWHWQCMDIPASVVARAVSFRLSRASAAAPPGPAFVQLESKPGEVIERRQDY
jgi:heptosyltransferase I